MFCCQPSFGKAIANTTCVEQSRSVRALRVSTNHSAMQSLYLLLHRGTAQNTLWVSHASHQPIAWSGRRWIQGSNFSNSQNTIRKNVKINKPRVVLVMVVVVVVVEILEALLAVVVGCCCWLLLLLVVVVYVCALCALCACMCVHGVVYGACVVYDVCAACMSARARERTHVGVVVVVVVGGGGGIVDGAGLTIRWQGLWILLEPPLLT